MAEEALAVSLPWLGQNIALFLGNFHPYQTSDMRCLPGICVYQMIASQAFVLMSQHLLDVC